MTLAEAISLSAVYYTYAENAYRGDFSSGRPGYPFERDFYDGSSIGAIDLLKHIDPTILPALIQHSVDLLSGRERDLAQSGIAALLGRYQPVVQRLDALGDDVTFLLEQLEAPNYEVNVISQFGLPQDGDPCFSSSFSFNVLIGDEQTYVAFWSIDHYLDTFWVRRYAEGSNRMVHSLMLQAEEALQAPVIKG